MDAAVAFPSLQTPTIIAAFRRTVDRIGDRPALRRCSGDAWEVLTWRDYGTAVAEVTAGLAEMGIGPGEQVAILSTNRVEWHLADIGTMANGSVTVPIYQTSSANQVAYVLGHSEARACFVEDHDQLGKVLQVRDDLPKLDVVVVFDDSARMDDPSVISMEQLRGVGAARLAREPALFETRSGAVQADDLATLVYTSGTTGPPKGVMITHANIMWTIRTAAPYMGVGEGERLLSFLPLSHIAERMMSDFAPIAVGGETWFARSLATVAQDLPVCRPTVFFAVPRVWEKFHEGVLEKVGDEHGIKKHILDRYLDLGLRKVAAEENGDRLAWPFEAEYRALDAVAGTKIRHQLGLDQAHILITAAAPIHPDLIRWFHAIGLPVLELYGQTEDCGPTAVNPASNNRIGTVGPALPGVTVRIADDGEILVKGGNVCAGYFKNAEGTAALLDDDGWMHSGDVGVLDADGYLRITGRKKDLIITAAGENISPQEIETDLRYEPFISQAVVIGERRRYLTVLVTLDADVLSRWAEERGKLTDPEVLADDPDVHAEIAASIERVNDRRSHAEGIRKFRVLAHDFTIAGGELTPTLKVKRAVVNEKYAALIEDMYAEEARS